MALEDVGHKDDSPTTSNRSGISPTATGCQKEDIGARSASKRSQSGEEKHSNGSARTVSEASKADSKTDERNSSTNSSDASSRADGNRKREKDVNSMKENDSNEGRPQVRELSEVDLKTGSVIETKGPSAAGNEDDASTVGNKLFHVPELVVCPYFSMRSYAQILKFANTRCRYHKASRSQKLAVT